MCLVYYFFYLKAKFITFSMREEIRNQTAHLELNSWKELHTFLKNSGLRYRVSSDESLHPMFFRKFYSQRSRVICNIILCNGFIKV